MSKQPVSGTCRRCGARFEAVPDKSFWGFQFVPCSGCGETHRLPLTKGYLITYYVFFLLMAFTVVIEASNGRLPWLPVIFSILIIVALLKDLALRRSKPT